jgi:hypothetical protein
MRRRFLVATALAVALLAPAAFAAPTTALFPADTFLYVEADAGALMKGIPELDIAKLIADPEVRECLAPALKRLRLDPEKPLQDLLGRLPVQQWVQGKVAIGVRGLAVTTERPDGTKVRTEISPTKPLNTQLFHEVLGAMAARELAWGLGMGRKPVTIQVELDMVATLQPGPRLEAMVEHYLENPPGYMKIDKVEVGGRSVLKLTSSWRPDRDFLLPVELYADVSGDTWILASSEANLATALAGGPESSLANSSDFNTVRQRLTPGGAVAFAYVDVAKMFGMLENLVAPIYRQEMEILGISSVRGLGAAVSMTEGGVRETFALVFDGRPRGVFRLLECMPGGLDVAKMAPGRTAAFLGAKFDLSILRDRAKDLAGTLLPGTETLIDPALERASRMIGIDIVGDLIPALGDEMGFLVFPPRGAMIPQGVFLMKVRDEERLGRVLEVAREHLGRMGGEVRELPMTDGAPGFYLVARDLPIQPCFVVRHGHLIGAIGPAQLRGFVRKWGKEAEAGKSLRNDEVYQKVLKGLGAGEGERLAFLAYVNLRRSLPPALNTALPFAGMMDGIDQWVDLAMVPEPSVIGDYFSGIGIAIQRDGNAFSIDLFSPTGITPGMVAGGMYAYEMQRRRHARWIREMEETRREMEEMRRRMEEGDSAVPAPSADEPFVGFNLDQTATGGVHIQSTIPGTPAAEIGLQAGDVIVQFQNTAITGFEDFRKAILEQEPGDTVTLGVKRGERTIYFKLVLGRRGDFVR